MTRVERDVSDGEARLTEVVAGFRRLTEWWTEEVSDELEAVAHQVDADVFDADAAAAAAGRLLVLPIVGWAALLNELGDAAAVASVRPLQPLQPSRKFHDPGAAGTDRRLRLVAPLVNGLGASLRLGSVRIVPSTLAKGDVDFRLDVDREGRVPGVYRGQVRITPRTGPSRLVDVSVQLG